MDALKKTQEDLQKGQQKLDDMLARLDKEQVIINCVVHILLVFKSRTETFCSK